MELGLGRQGGGIGPIIGGKLAESGGVSNSSVIRGDYDSMVRLGNGDGKVGFIFRKFLTKG